MPEITLTPDYLLTLAVGLLATVCQIMFALSTSRLRLLLFSFAASIGFMIQYALVSQWVGFWSAVIGTTYTGLLALGYRYRVFQTLPPMIIAAVGYVIVFITVTNWSGFTLPESIPLIAGVATLVALRSQNLILTKAIFISAGLLWLTYETFNGMFTQLIGEGFELVGNILTLALMVRASRASRARLATMATQPIPALDPVDTELLAVLRMAEQESLQEVKEAKSPLPPTQPLEIIRS